MERAVAVLLSSMRYMWHLSDQLKDIMYCRGQLRR